MCLRNSAEMEIFMDTMRLKAYAKINLGLDVIRKREDGYHEVRMVMQMVNLYDKIELSKRKTPGIEVKTNLYYLPANQDNLVYKAAHLLMEEFQIKEGIQINLRKYIPVSAGMAGGSSDAAAVLFGINRMFQLGLSLEELMKRGVRLGADIPYCIMRGTALSEGIGEKLTALPPAPPCKVLIAKPAINVSTKFVYENLNLKELTFHPDIDGIVKHIKRKNIEEIAKRLGNVLETVTISAYPVIEDIKTTMKEQGALNALMSGSGPTVFGLFAEEEKAQAAFGKIKSAGLAKQVYLTNFHT